MAITILRQKIAAIKKFDIVKETIQIINDNSFYLIGLLRIQLQKGSFPDGERVTITDSRFGKRDYYLDSTIHEKERHGVGLGKQTEWITNFMSGDFYDKIVLHTKGTKFILTSDVSYFTDITGRSGTLLMELSEEHLEDFKEEILIPKLRERLKIYGL